MPIFAGINVCALMIWFGVLSSENVPFCWLTHGKLSGLSLGAGEVAQKCTWLVLSWVNKRKERAFLRW